MTTGNTGEVWEMGPFTGLRYGIVRNRQWSGTDAITPATPIGTYNAVIRNLRDLRVRIDANWNRSQNLRKEIDEIGYEIMASKLALQRATLERPTHLTAKQRNRLRRGKPVRAPSTRAELYATLNRLNTARQLKRNELKKLSAARKQDVARRRVWNLRKRALPPNPYWAYYSRSTRSGLVTKSGTVAASYGNYFPLGTSVPIPPNQRYALLAKIRNKVYGSGFNPFVFSAEGRKTVKMIGDAARDLDLAYRAARRGNVKAFLRAIRGSADEKRVREAFSKDLASRHLMVVYGVRPLLDDMEDGAKFIAQAVNGGDPTGSRIAVRRSYALPVETYTGAAGYYWKTRRQVVKHQIIVYPNKVANAYLPGIMDLVSVVWERTPFSFIGDWLFPIQKHIDALRLANSVKGTWVESITRHEYYLDPTVKPGQNPVIGHRLPIDDSEYILRFNRTVSKDMPIPSLKDVIKYSSAKSVLNVLRTANLLALARTSATKGLGTKY